MTAPRWIAEALEAADADRYDFGVPDPVREFDVDKFANALIERLPLEAMIIVADRALANLGDGLAVSLRTEHAVARLVIKELICLLADDDPDVVTLTELYQDACRALDDAGVPYADPSQHDACGPPPMLDLAGRIRWLAQQRPIRAELDNAHATRKLAEEMATKYMSERDAARTEVANHECTIEALKEIYATQTSMNVVNMHARDAAEDEAESLRRQLADRDAQIEALEAEVADLEGQIFELDPEEIGGEW